MYIYIYGLKSIYIYIYIIIYIHIIYIWFKLFIYNHLYWQTGIPNCSSIPVLRKLIHLTVHLIVSFLVLQNSAMQKCASLVRFSWTWTTSETLLANQKKEFPVAQNPGTSMMQNQSRNRAVSRLYFLLSKLWKKHSSRNRGLFRSYEPQHCASPFSVCKYNQD